jgi:hypothetical protein
MGTDGFAYVNQKVLAGFLSEPLKKAFFDDYFSGCTQEEADRVRREYAAAQEFCAGLKDSRPHTIVFHEIPSVHSDHLQKVRTNLMFQQLVGANYMFAIADLRDAIAVQPNVIVEDGASKAVPEKPTQAELVRSCLPDGYTMELLITVGANQVVFSGFDNNLNGVGVVHQPPGLPLPTLFPISRGNWVQVARCQGKIFLLNGYHRVAKYIMAETFDIPCVVRDFASPDQMGFGQGRFFDLKTLMTMTRPPLMGDFATRAAISLPGKRVRTTMVATLQVTPLSIPG